jgi:dTDP-4-amino-4,6-dideoxygalactose transaminase
MNIPFHKPIFPNDINKILFESINSGWVTSGPKVKQFEQKLCNYLNAKHVIAVNSGTAALHLALAAKGIKQGDKFIAPTYTFVATVEVGEYLNATPILVDSESDSFNMDLNQVEDILKNNNIKVIIPVHIGGEAIDMKSLVKLAEKYNVFILEDAAHSLETVSNIGKVGNSDHAVAFSFYANKNITTGGEGGALSTNDSVLAERVRRLSLHGMSKDGWQRFITGNKWAYDVSELGYKYNMTDIAASFGLEQMSHIEDWHTRRLKIIKQYNEGMSKINGLILPQHKRGEVHSWHLYVVRIKPDLWKISRNKLIHKINEKGIGTSVHYIPVHMHSYYENKYGYKPDDYPNAKYFSETVISLPLFPSLKHKNIIYINSTIESLWKKYKA